MVRIGEATVDACLRVFGHHSQSVPRPVREALVRAGLDVVEAAPDGEGQTVPLLCLFDRVSPGLNEALRTAARARLRVLAVAMSAADLGPGDAWSLLEAGASDVLAWDRSPDPGRDIAARLGRWSGVDELLRSDLVRGNLVGDSPVWTSILRQLIEVARFTQAGVLITGESGTGKELVARLIHTLDPRPEKGQLVVVDCTTVVPTLSGSEFFGHERGAFTGAVSARDGAFARANGGTLFLDEVGELPLMLQAELLRVIQEGMYKRVGSDTWRETRFRLVCATNRSLTTAQADGAFRTDLYHRIAGWSCELPPLRDRTADVLPLVRHFLGQVMDGGRVPDLDPAVVAYLDRRSYHGNIRELRLLVARIAARHVGDGPITVGDLPDSERPDAPLADRDGRDEAFRRAIGHALSEGLGLVDIGRVARDTAVAMALEAEAGDTRRAARRLGVSERAIQLRKAQVRPASGLTEDP
jgi:transcriptional regulator with GAF, ATPase, and Fis domain